MDMLSPQVLWLIAGAIFVAIEAIGVSGIGFFFAGLAALCVGVIIELGLMQESHIAQFAAFFILTAIWALLLWKPLKKGLLFSKSSQNYNNMIGEVAIVSGSGLKPGVVGDVLWSGTIMKAELAQNIVDVEVTSGTQVVISGVRGATLIVELKQ